MEHRSSSSATPRRAIRWLSIWTTASLLVVLLVAVSPGVARAAANGVVDGVCDEAEFDAELAALPEGGTLTFRCPFSVRMISFSTVKTIEKSLAIDGSVGSTETITLSGGGARRLFQVRSNAAVTLQDVSLIGGKHVASGDPGGAINVNNAWLTLNHVTVALSEGGNGGGLGVVAGTASIFNSAFIDNRSFASGGAVYADENSGLFVVETEFRGNDAETSGGGIWSDGGYDVQRSLFSGNDAYLFGGGLGTMSGPVGLISDSTFVGNEAADGSAILHYGGAFSMNGVTAVRNFATNQRAVQLIGDPIRIGNSVIAENIGDRNCYIPEATSLGGNIDDDGSCPFKDAGDRQGVSVRLGQLASNGGPTQTLAPLPGSPVVNAGQLAGCSAKDQRGVERPQGAACDSGAFEVEVSPPLAPGAPYLDPATNPNQGAYEVRWSSVSDPHGVTYVLERRDRDDATFSQVATGLTQPSYTFPSSNPEGEGRWQYRVRAVDGYGFASGWTHSGQPRFTVDRTPPNAPRLAPDRAPDYVSADRWFKDNVVITTNGRGDPRLPDGSAGSGVNPASVQAPVTWDIEGAWNASAAVADRAGNVSAVTSYAFQIDASAPDVQIVCPKVAYLNVPRSVGWTATDGQSGLATQGSGTVGLDTSSLGQKTFTVTATDNVGHTSTRTCIYQVRYRWGGFFAPVDNRPFVNEMPAGAGVTLAFTLGGDQGLDIFERQPYSYVTPCELGNVDVIERTVNASTSSLRYNAANGRYVWTWKTSADWAGTCRTFVLPLKDGSRHIAYFHFTE